MNPLKSGRSPTFENVNRTSGLWKIDRVAEKDFFNTIGPKPTMITSAARSALGAGADQGVADAAFGFLTRN